MSRKYTAPVRTPTRDVSITAPSQSSPLSNGAIAGIAIGGAVAVIATIAGIWFCCRRRRLRGDDPIQQTTPGMASVTPMHINSPPSGAGSMWSPGSSHQTPGPPSPHGTGTASIFGYPQPPAPAAVIPNHPIEMPGHVHDCGASEIYDHATPNSTMSAGGYRTPIATGLVSPYSAGPDPIKYGNKEWPSPVREVEFVHPVQRGNLNFYAAGGFGPQELDTDPTTDRGNGDERRHETFYHG
jgi:hypothetical protein